MPTAQPAPPATPENTPSAIVRLAAAAPTRTHTATHGPTGTAEPEPEQSDSLSYPPTATAVPILEADPFFTEMQNKGYAIAYAGSLAGPEGYIYSAYIFLEPNPNKPYLRDESKLGTWIIAFYVWDGQRNNLVGTFYAPPYTRFYPEARYPQNYSLLNWDAPMFIGGISYFPGDLDTHQLKLNGFSSDINHNGLPEFSFMGYFCPVSCTHPDWKYDFFEIRNTHTIVDLAADLPDHIEPYPYATDPMTYKVCITRGYEFYLNVTICRPYAWVDDQFMDVTRNYSQVYVGMAEEEKQKLQADYGNPFDNHDLAALRMLLFYETAGQREKAVQAFLEVTDISHWPGTGEIFACWMQISRATVQEDYAINRPFSLPPGTMYLGYGVERYLEKFDQSKYDFAACQNLSP